MAKVIIEAIATPNIWHFTEVPELCIYANENFIADDGTLVLAGDPNNPNAPHLKVPCELTGGTTLLISGFEIDSIPFTMPTFHSARYTAILRTPSPAVPGYQATYLADFSVPPEPTNMNWNFLRTYQHLGRRFSHGPAAEFQAMVTSMIADALTYRSFASTTNVGNAALTTNPDDPAFPIAVSATDPRILSIGGPGQLIDVTLPPYSVLNDGTAQSTAGLQAALDAARDSNGQYRGVYFPPGNYVFNSGSVTIYQGLALVGSWEGAPGHGWQRFPTSPDATDGKGTTIQITAGAGGSAGAFITMHSNTTLRGVVFYYPNQLTSAASPTLYPWTVFIGKSITEGVGDVTVENCEFINSYQAIQCKWSARLHLRNIGGAPVFGIDIDKAYDTTWFENIQWNTYRFSSWDATAPNNNYGIYVNQNGVGIKAGRVDALLLHNCYILGYRKGIETVETAAEGSLPGGKPWMQVVGGGIESCGYGAYLAAAQHPLNSEGAGVDFLGVNFSGYDHIGATGGYGIFVTSAFRGTLRVSGGMFGNGSGPAHLYNIRIEGGGRILIENCHFLHATNNNIYANAPGGGGGLGDLALSILANHFETSTGASVTVEGFTTCSIAANNFVGKLALPGLSTITSITENTQTGYVVTITPDNRFGDNTFPFGEPSNLLGKLFSALDAVEIYSNFSYMTRGTARQGSLTLRGHESGTTGLGSMSINAAFNGANWLRQIDANDAWLIQGTSTPGSTGGIVIYHAPPGSGAITWTAVLTLDAAGLAQMAVKTKAGAPVDGDFVNPRDGLGSLDITNHRIYYRSGGTWKFAQLT